MILLLMTPACNVFIIALLFFSCYKNNKERKKEMKENQYKFTPVEGKDVSERTENVSTSFRV